MIHVQSSWFPLVDRNPQKFVDIYKATDADFQKATERVYRSGAQRSDDPTLVATARSAIADPANDVLVSAASIWPVSGLAAPAAAA